MCYFFKKKTCCNLLLKKITCCAKREKKITCREEKSQPPPLDIKWSVPNTCLEADNINHLVTMSFVSNRLIPLYLKTVHIQLHDEKWTGVPQW